MSEGNLLLLAVAAFVAVASLVRMMTHQRDELLAEKHRREQLLKRQEKRQKRKQERKQQREEKQPENQN